MGDILNQLPGAQSAITALLGAIAIGWFFYQVFSRIRIENGQKELNEERRKDAFDLRSRITDLETRNAELSDRLLETTHASSGAGAVVVQLQRQNIVLERQIKELKYELVMLETACEECKENGEKQRMLLAQAKFFLDGCKGCQNPTALQNLIHEIPRHLPHGYSNDVTIIEADTD